MKRIIPFMLILLLLTGCASSEPPAQIAATTLPVYEFTCRITEGTGITVTRLVTESVSCLHDYSLNVKQVKAAEAAELIVISGAGLEVFMEDILVDRDTVDASSGIEMLECATEHGHEHEHDHAEDPHIWLSPANAKIMAQNICAGLTARYPQHGEAFQANLFILLGELDALQAYGEAQLGNLRSREIITFHDGFGYFADSFGLTILEAVEEESGSEASARELIHLIGVTREQGLSAIFTEENGSVSAADVISRETGADLYTLSMAMSGDGYFEAMYHNIDTIKEALG